MYDLSNAYFTDSVLIDTWWNVNSNSAPQEPEEEKF